MKLAELSFETAADRIGEEIAVTDWFDVTQPEVNAFADATRDHNWLHVDPERSAREGPAGGTIAHGFYTLSMLSYFSYETELWPEGTAYGMNYGLNKVRFIAPVPVGKRVRMHFVLRDFALQDSGGYLMTTECTAEIEGQTRPGMVAEWLGIFFPKEEGEA